MPPTRTPTPRETRVIDGEPTTVYIGSDRDFYFSHNDDGTLDTIYIEKDAAKEETK